VALAAVFEIAFKQVERSWKQTGQCRGVCVVST